MNRNLTTRTLTANTGVHAVRISVTPNLLAKSEKCISEILQYAYENLSDGFFRLFWQSLF
jgi:hypothetical protein